MIFSESTDRKIGELVDALITALRIYAASLVTKN